MTTTPPSPIETEHPTMCGHVHKVGEGSSVCGGVHLEFLLKKKKNGPSGSVTCKYYLCAVHPLTTSGRQVVCVLQRGGGAFRICDCRHHQHPRTVLAMCICKHVTFLQYKQALFAFCRCEG